MAFRGRFILNTIYFASKRGADKAALIALSGHSEAVLEKENTIVDDQTYNAIIAYAVAQTANPFFGLHLGESQNLAAAGLMLQIIQSSKTVKQALGYVCHFSNLGCDALPMQLEEEKFYYKLSLRPSELWQQQSPLAVEQTAAGILTFTLRQFRNLSRAQYNPIAVHLTWDRPAIIDEYERIWNCRVEFQQAEIAILLKKAQVEEQVMTADFDLLQILVAHAEEKSNKIQQEQGFAALVRATIIQLVQPQFPSIEQVAANLNTSVRTLQRRLKADNYTYKQLLDETRKDFALSYLNRPNISMSEVAYLLGYADTSVFSRSFKRWTGVSPTEYRKQKVV